MINCWDIMKLIICKRIIDAYSFNKEPINLGSLFFYLYNSFN